MIGQIDIEKSLLNAPNDRSLFVAVASVVNSLVDAVNVLQAQVAILQEHAHPTAKTPAENVLTMVDNQVTADLPNIDVGELAFLSKENTELKDEIDRLETELERTRKALDVAVNALKLLKEKAYLTEYAQGVVAKALDEITALEQKDK